MVIALTMLPLFLPKMPPIGPGYLQSFLARKNIKAEIFDLNNLFYSLSDKNLQKQWLISCNVFLERGILYIVRKNHPKEYRLAVERMLDFDMAGFSCFKSNFSSTLEMSELLKSRKKDIKIVLGGPEITRQFFRRQGLFSKEINRCADYLVAGEGEVGYPGESDADFQESLDFIIANKDNIPKIEQVNPFTYYDGTQADKSQDYKINRGSLRRMEILLGEIEHHNFKYTNAFLGNLIEKDACM